MGKRIHDEGLFLKVKIIPASVKTEIVGWEGELLKIRIAAPPEKGKANKALIAFLSKHFGIPQSSITIISGETSRIKKLHIKKLLPLEEYLPPRQP